MTSETDYALLANRVYSRSFANKIELVGEWQEFEWSLRTDAASDNDRGWDDR